jgi:hypothetical protein
LALLVERFAARQGEAADVEVPCVSRSSKVIEPENPVYVAVVRTSTSCKATAKTKTKDIKMIGDW